MPLPVLITAITKTAFNASSLGTPSRQVKRYGSTPQPSKWRGQVARARLHLRASAACLARIQVKIRSRLYSNRLGRPMQVANTVKIRLRSLMGSRARRCGTAFDVRLGRRGNLTVSCVWCHFVDRRRRDLPGSGRESTTSAAWFIRPTTCGIQELRFPFASGKPLRGIESVIGRSMPSSSSSASETDSR
ncbi:hypothetical protein HDG37_002983 [Paraburkholderia sp. MM5384-R2]|nr:hypothetical protein [Paraburkholderia sp. MM5384-R2]